MLGTFSTLHMAARSLAAQRQATEVTGQNLANVNNPAYSRQRVNMQTSASFNTSDGIVSTGVEVAGIEQIRDTFLDQQIQSETSTRSSLQSQQDTLTSMEALLGQKIDVQGSADATDPSSGGLTGLQAGLSNFFSSLQTLSTDPTSSTQRSLVLQQADALAQNFNDTASQLSDIHDGLNDQLQGKVDDANDLLSQIATLNGQITSYELRGGTANDLRDTREQKLEDLSQLVDFKTVNQSDGSLNVVVGGELMVNGSSVSDSLQLFDNGGGQLLVQSASTQSPLSIGGGTIHGMIETRDGALADQMTRLNTLAGQFISQVNGAYSNGYDLNGNTGATLFDGTTASTIAVNASVMADPTLFQGGGPAGATGDNSAILAMAQLANQKIAGLANQTFSSFQNATVASAGAALNSVNQQLDNQNVVDQMLQQKRQSVSGVSLDEEMTNLLTFQKAFEASARLMSTIDQMLDTIVNLKS